MSTRQLHLGVNVLSDGMHPAAWQYPGADPNWFTDLSFWTNLARIAERGTLDALFLADSPSLFQNPGEPLVAPPLALDPLILLSTLASVTTHLGLIATVSTSFEEPYNVARRFASLDHLSRGRVAWNVVTSSDPYAWNNFGGTAQPDRAQRYRRAAEFIDVVRALWDSWDDDAVLADKASGAFSRPGAIHTIGHRGEFFSVDGPLTLPRTPQGHPVLFQAGGSPGGLDLAARYADGVFAAQASLPDALRNAADLKARTVAHGRPRDAIRIMPGLSFVLGSTEAEARRRHDELNELAGERRLAHLAAQLSVNPAELSWDQPLPQWLLDGAVTDAGSQGARDIVVNLARRERLTVRELLERVITWHRLVIGGPEQIADAIEEWFVAGAVDGFNLMPDVFPSGLELFVEHVIPILRQRGLFRREYTTTTLRGHLGLGRIPDRRTVARAG
ncbi:nitrilotriacetate monooxygenase component A [Mycolicibacterium anyangense]|uniref:Nitrilotriacetate monooxygenase component A n=1 Tax=Mycolicibacterium anyangense TaxID=1431246 RepID=A0A6N4W060_9MYCO|nr:LLM class flavin-dependent oxidoreductase [Mycolicibacterium anyangense]BBZ75326.1 nitrilotriacetate monooxygenase component A [Mycolicibacterium anyangense]